MVEKLGGKPDTFLKFLEGRDAVFALTTSLIVILLIEALIGVHYLARSTAKLLILMLIMMLLIGDVLVVSRHKIHKMLVVARMMV